MIVRNANKEPVLLLQDAFPPLEKYIDYVHTENGVPVHVAEANLIFKSFKLKYYLTSKN